MCGLFGCLSSTLVDVEIDRVKQLGIMSQLRGDHSTGVAVVYRDKNKVFPATYKKAINATNFFNTKEGNHILYKMKPFIVCGHTRHATCGEVNDANAHPFKEGNIIGMHNGTIFALQGTKDEKGNEKPDSRVLMELIDEVGIEKALKEAYYGAYAICWIDMKDASVNFVRNIDRPLNFMWHGGTLYWASEYAALEFLRARENLSIPKIFTLNEDELFRIDIHTRRSTFTQLKVERPFSFKHEKKEDNNPNEIVVHQLPNYKVTETVDGVLYERKSASGIPLVPMLQKKHAYKGFRGKKMPVSKAEELLRKGCAFTGELMEIHDLVYWINNDEYIIPCIKDDPFVKEYMTKHGLHEGGLVEV